MRLQNIRDVLAKNRRDTRDVRYVVYEGPLGAALHRVVNPVGGCPTVVGSSLGRVTFPPGSQVPLGSESGAGGQFIMGLPPPGARGGAAFARVSRAVSVAHPTLLRASPATVGQGASETVYFIGLNLLEDPVDTILAVIEDPDDGSLSTHPGVAVTDLAFVVDPAPLALGLAPGELVVEGTVTVDSSVPVGERLDFEVTRSPPTEV